MEARVMARAEWEQGGPALPDPAGVLAAAGGDRFAGLVPAAVHRAALAFAAKRQVRERRAAGV